MIDCYNVDSYDYSSEDRFLLDANVWLAIHGPLPFPTKKQTIYSGAFKKIRQAGCSLFLDQTVLSEYINRFARYEKGNSSRYRAERDFKVYRDSNEFKEVALRIASQARRIVDWCSRCDSSFSQMNIVRVLEDFALSKKDFNDQILANVCSRENLKLITHDKDFREFELTVITANQVLLST